MTNSYEAIETLSAELFQRVKRLAGDKGWGARSYTWQLILPEKHFHSVTATTVHLPQGRGVTFLPRPEPAGETWPIDIRRTDGVVRERWANPLRAMKSGDSWVLWYRSAAVKDEELAAILDDIGNP